LFSHQNFAAEHGKTVVVSTVVFVVCSAINAVVSQKSTDTAKISKHPQPKWGVLQALNYVVLATFVGSVTYAGLNYRKISAELAMNGGGDGGASPLTSFLFPLMILWTLCLAYFFGFFGISLVDTEALGESPSSFGLAELKREADTHAEAAKAKAHMPRNDAPICNPEAGKVPRTIPEVAPLQGEVEPDYPNMSDEDVLETLLDGKLKDYQLEKKLGDYERAVFLRRALYENILDRKLDLIPFAGYDYNQVFGANCEIVIGYVPLPVGIVGPLTINSEPVYIPMATTEGCLVASTNRGCKAISASGGCNSILLKDAITRAPCLRFPSALRAAALKKWVATEENYLKLEAAFNGTTKFGKLQSCECTVAGRNVYMRFCCMSGDAMGMNMVSKGCLAAIEVLEGEFPDLILVAISGNMCTDKKPAAINWILGRGKSVVVEAVIPDRIVKSVLKSSVHDMIETNKQKNHIGSAMAGSIGGFNAHAANIVTAVFLATGQDPAQNVESSNCLTIMEYADDGESLHVSVTMPSIEVGTVGGGTSLPAQAGCLEICGVRGAAKGEGSSPGDNARKLAMIVGSAVLAGELSLIAALAANHLVRSHMQHNRKPVSSAAQAVAGMRKNASMPALSNRS
jgi:hydroxymethylglutaryl-CoA reductase (NADPH)